MKNINISRSQMGSKIATMEVVHNTNGIISVTIEKFGQADGMANDCYMFLIDGKISNFVGYPTIQKAINAAARAKY